jgi:drug/metabolite transporter (DMT)-like permease
VAIAAGFLGALVILRPGFHEINLGQLAQLCAAPLFAASFLLAKRLTRDQSPTAIVAMLTLTVTLALLPGAIAQWREPSMMEVFWMSLTAVFATAGHYAQTRAYQAAPITVTQPVGFLQIVWATLLGLVAFGEPVDPFVILGAAIVVGAASYISHREARIYRAAITPPVTATKL